MGNENKTTTVKRDTKRDENGNIISQTTVTNESTPEQPRMTPEEYQGFYDLYVDPIKKEAEEREKASDEQYRRDLQNASWSSATELANALVNLWGTAHRASTPMKTTSSYDWMKASDAGLAARREQINNLRNQQRAAELKLLQQAIKKGYDPTGEAYKPKPAPVTTPATGGGNGATSVVPQTASSTTPADENPMHPTQQTNYSTTPANENPMRPMQDARAPKEKPDWQSTIGTTSAPAAPASKPASVTTAPAAASAGVKTETKSTTQSKAAESSGKKQVSAQGASGKVTEGGRMDQLMKTEANVRAESPATPAATSKPAESASKPAAKTETKPAAKTENKSSVPAQQTKPAEKKEEKKTVETKSSAAATKKEEPKEEKKQEEKPAVKKEEKKAETKQEPAKPAEKPKDKPKEEKKTESATKRDDPPAQKKLVAVKDGEKTVYIREDLVEEYKRSRGLDGSRSNGAKSDGKPEDKQEQKTEEKSEEKSEEKTEAKTAVPTDRESFQYNPTDKQRAFITQQMTNYRRGWAYSAQFKANPPFNEEDVLWAISGGSLDGYSDSAKRMLKGIADAYKQTK